MAVPVVLLLDREIGSGQPEVPVAVAQGQEMLADQAYLVRERMADGEIPVEPLTLEAVAVAQQLLVLVLPLLPAVMEVQGSHHPFQTHR